MDFGPETFAARMPDDSMAPDLPRGWWAFVDPDEPMGPGRLLGVDDPEAGVVTVRRLVEEDGRMILRSADPGWWPDIVVTADNETMIRGTVVVVGRAV